jgi:hypothetical protein
MSEALCPECNASLKGPYQDVFGFIYYCDNCDGQYTPQMIKNHNIKEIAWELLEALKDMYKDMGTTDVSIKIPYIEQLIKRAENHLS